MISRTPNLQFASLVHENSGYPVGEIYPPVDFSLWSKLEFLEITRAYALNLLTLPRRLKYLDITENHLPLLSLEAEDVTQIGLPLLETFMCEYTDLGLEAILAIIGPSLKAGNLKKLHIGDYSPDDSPGNLYIPTYEMPSLQELSLYRCRMREDDIMRFLRLCPNVQYLDLSLTRVTGVAIKEVMARESGPLKWLGVNHCTYLSSDAVEWARSLGTVVEYNNSSVKRIARQKFWRDRWI